MKRGVKMRIFLLLLPLLAAACGKPAIRYDLGEDWSKVHSSREGINVAVVLFLDERPAEEKDPNFSLLEDHLRDDSFRDSSVAAGVAVAVARHLNECKLFGTTAYVGQLPDETADAGLERLRREGYDAVLSGTVRHFTATSYGAKRMYLYMFRPLLSWIPGSGERWNDLDSRVELGDVRLVSTRTGELLWEGRSERRMRRYHGADRKEELLRATLQAAVWDLVGQLHDIDVPASERDN